MLRPSDLDRSLNCPGEGSHDIISLACIGPIKTTKCIGRRWSNQPLVTRNRLTGTLSPDSPRPLRVRLAPSLLGLG